MSISVCVYVSWRRFVLFACVHGYESLSVVRPCLNAHLHLCGSVPVYLCGACACKTDTRVFCGFISELWTSWVHAGGGKFSVHCLSKPLYNDWDSRSCLLSLLCSFETRKITSQKDNLSCDSDRLQVQESLQVEVFPVCFSEESLNLNFAVSRSSAAKSSNLKRTLR